MLGGGGGGRGGCECECEYEPGTWETRVDAVDGRIWGLVGRAVRI